MTLDEALAALEALGDESVRERNRRRGAAENQYGVKLGDIRALAKQIKADQELGMALWATENVDARLLAILLVKPRTIPAAQLDDMVRSVGFVQVADWLNAYVVRRHPDNEALRSAWLATDDPWAARAGWDLTAERVAKSPDGMNLPALLDRIERELAGAAPEVQWTMNNCLAAIGIAFPEHRERALGIGESLGVYRDYPVSKGCTSPFAPIWINEIVGRQSA